MQTVINLDIWAVGGEHDALNLWFAGLPQSNNVKWTVESSIFNFQKNIKCFNFFTAVKECQVDNGEAHEQVVRQFWYWAIPHFEIPNLLEILKLYFYSKICI